MIQQKEKTKNNFGGLVYSFYIWVFKQQNNMTDSEVTLLRLSAESKYINSYKCEANKFQKLREVRRIAEELGELNGLVKDKDLDKVKNSNFKVLGKLVGENLAEVKIPEGETYEQ